ncbi:GntR family transcriptional regulator [Billgrantia endophytica]|uniref:GntR family transcriptional regulator n=1 Tax=Billgrantia endophytica TaxID=2033802 RepID=A0A2N7U5R3_9GAMM|nr:GntR family transcriptional regulator [Halomonas endophytica]PMR75775.1 GntR family transcriptional regulator [Halomonas endophytica]
MSTQSPLSQAREGNTVDEMLEQVADEIIRGDIAPGTKLDARVMAERFAVSRTPVREMFAHLAAMGLVVRRPNRGVTVAEISDENLMAMYEAMAELEAACARLCALRMTLKERQSLQRLHQSALHHVRDGTTDDYEAYNLEFHSRLYAGAHSPCLRDMALTTRSRLQPFRHAQFRLPQRPSHSWEEHDAIVGAILAGDAEAAARATRAHVLQVSHGSRDYLESNRGNDRPRGAHTHHDGDGGCDA